ncbi:cysteine hydrolase family protein [Klebsiella aerogenes]
MSTKLKSITQNSALLVMDFQKSILNNYIPHEHLTPIIQRTASLISSARTAGVKVIYICVGFRKGYPEVGKNSLFKSIKYGGQFLIDSSDSAIHDELAPEEDEPVVIKCRVGAFSFTELELILRSYNIDTLILTGITTSGVILSTARQAFDLDYRLIIAKDCCADTDVDINNYLLDKILSQHADVVHASDIAEAWNLQTNYCLNSSTL